MEMRKLTDKDLKPREIIPPVGKGNWSNPIKPTKLPPLQVVVSTLEKMEHDLNGTAVVMGALNFVLKRLTGYFWFKNKIGVKNDQSVWSRLIELINVLITKLKEW